MENKDMMQVPYIVYEQAEVRHERTVKRLVWALVISIVLIFASNMAWLWYESQFEYVGESVEIEADDGNANYIGNNGDINNGTN